MNGVRLTATATILAVATWMWFPDRAEASEWGCEVLLCASSSNPSWRGVPACHAPMYRLISAMGNWGFSWPTCPEAGTGKPGYEAYDDCQQTVTTARPLREDPYYFDIRHDDGNVTRHWFSLRR